ncbi:A/G-specific adenine glycosylase [Candidatus Kaiserbacteria bacterium]|nr:A/G-specific adenine glycosylase [Candidatus Kaiserbacteria bacterium]
MRQKKADLTTLVWEARRHYREEVRAHLPWRATRDPYKILVSEVMLQQTQVERVIPYYKKFVRTFPSARVLARVSLLNVLHVWQGLGYNRRAKFLHQAAKILATKKTIDLTTGFLESLPGVGHYTARAVAVFAFNRPEVFVETNIRTVFFYHLGPKRKLSDKQLLPLVERALQESGMEPREFYSAMMDYGAHLKRQGIRLNQKSTHYTKQSKFEGSTRQLRGVILRELLKHHATLSVLAHQIPRSREDLTNELARLTAEGLVSLHGRYFAIKS